jgi:hypothetical protein
MKLLNVALLAGGAYFLISKMSGTSLYSPPAEIINSSATKGKQVEWAKNPGYENVVNGLYYNVNGQIYSDEAYAIWQERDGKWYAGNKSGQIASISAPSWSS